MRYSACSFPCFPLRLLRYYYFSLLLSTSYSLLKFLSFSSSSPSLLGRRLYDRMFYSISVFIFYSAFLLLFFLWPRILLSDATAFFCSPLFSRCRRSLLPFYRVFISSSAFSSLVMFRVFVCLPFSLLLDCYSRSPLSYYFLYFLSPHFIHLHATSSSSSSSSQPFQSMSTL
jgi:hypothetical protein